MDKLKALGKKRLLAIAIGIALVVAIAGGTFWYTHNQTQIANAEQDATARAIYEKYDALSKRHTPDLDANSREDIVDDIKALQSLEATVTRDKNAFMLHDGSYYKFDNLKIDISTIIERIGTWLVDSYTISMNEYVVDLTSENVEDFEISSTNLNNLLSRIESETVLGIWKSEKPSRALIEEIKAKITANNTRIEEAKTIIAEREAEAASQVQTAVLSNQGGGVSYGSGNYGLPTPPDNRPSRSSLTWVYIGPYPNNGGWGLIFGWDYYYFDDGSQYPSTKVADPATGETYVFTPGGYSRW
jgi:hypothetical protein